MEIRNEKKGKKEKIGGRMKTIRNRNQSIEKTKQKVHL